MTSSYVLNVPGTAKVSRPTDTTSGPISTTRAVGDIVVVINVFPGKEFLAIKAFQFWTRRRLIERLLVILLVLHHKRGKQMTTILCGIDNSGIS
jgi:hypothetical protein